MYDFINIKDEDMQRVYNIGLCLFQEKNKRYGNSFSKQFFRDGVQRGLLKSIIRLEDKLSRIDNISFKIDLDYTKDESLEDSLLDMMNYCALTLACLRKEKDYKKSQDNIKKAIYNPNSNALDILNEKEQEN